MSKPIPFTATEHRRDVPWAEAKLPRRWHFCRWQSRGWSHGYFIERCACGAVRVDGLRWVERNSSRRWIKSMRRRWGA